MRVYVAQECGCGVQRAGGGRGGAGAGAGIAVEGGAGIYQGPHFSVVPSSQ